MTDEERTEENEDVEAHGAAAAGRPVAGPTGVARSDEGREDEDDVEAHGMNVSNPGAA